MMIASKANYIGLCPMMVWLLGEEDTMKPHTYGTLCRHDIGAPIEMYFHVRYVNKQNFCYEDTPTAMCRIHGRLIYSGNPSKSRHLVRCPAV